ncbi:trigger factor [Escherichia coli O146:H21 str. 2010C-3325]|nr:trigger factor [Escherichia coli O146:H21 str. 2010C-3325]
MKYGAITRTANHTAGAIRLFCGSSWWGGPVHGAGGRGKRRIF